MPTYTFDIDADDERAALNELVRLADACHIHAESSDPSEKTVFAVLSKDDCSLRLYNRREVPDEGGVLDGRSVDFLWFGNVWLSHGIEYVSGLGADGWRYPWREHADEVLSMRCEDDGIRPFGTTTEFCADLDRLKYCDLSKLDMSEVYDVSFMFAGCKSLESLDIHGWSPLPYLDLPAEEHRRFTRKARFCEAAGFLEPSESPDLSSLDVSGVTCLDLSWVKEAFPECSVSGLPEPPADRKADGQGAYSLEGEVRTASEAGKSLAEHPSGRDAAEDRDER